VSNRARTRTPRLAWGPATTGSGEVAEHLKGSALFSVLPASDVEELVAAAVSRSFRPGQRLFSENEPSVAIHVIVRGVVRLFRSNRKGQLLTLRRLSAGSVLGQMSALDASGHSVSAEAEDQVEVLAIPRTRYIAALKRHPEAALALARILADIVRRLSDELEAMKFSTIESRLLDKICERAAERREVVVTHATLAAEVGATRENVSRLLGRLKKKGVVALGRGRIEILDHRGLEQMRGGGTRLS